MSGRIITIAAIVATLTLNVTAAFAQAPAPPAPAASPSSGPLPGEQQGTVPAGDYRIGPEDLLHIIVWKNEPMSRIVLVRPDGHISLPLLNDVKAAGLTPMQLRDILVKSLAEYMPSPEVSVIVNDIRSFKVSVIGEVRTSGRFELTGPVTVLDVLAMAGGFNDYANRGGVVVLRRVGSITRRMAFAYDSVKSGKGSSSEPENFLVQPNDIILVP